jgi:hypothetical protein
LRIEARRLRLVSKAIACIEPHQPLHLKKGQVVQSTPLKKPEKIPKISYKKSLIQEGKSYHRRRIVKIQISVDGSDQVLSFSKSLTYGGSSDDTAPMYVRNVVFLEVLSRGPITKQTIPFAMQAIVDGICQHYQSLSVSCNRYNYYDFSERKDALELLEIVCRTGKFNGSGMYFPLSRSVNVDEFLKQFQSLIGKLKFCFLSSNLINMRHCWASHLLFVSQTGAAFFTFFSYD